MNNDPTYWSAVETIFEEVADLDTASRAEALDVRCGNRQDFRAEIESLLGPSSRRGIHRPPSQSSKKHSRIRHQGSAALSARFGLSRRSARVGWGRSTSPSAQTEDSLNGSRSRSSGPPSAMLAVPADSAPNGRSLRRCVILTSSA